eukprot:NODE_1285_length_1566_cov_64.582349_g1214_i0.p1 GENE.NODE_1285_length_1566_cov_64.582349_g1214_i0~~NODE_1285_length_1566_cov_64.582349_g1214_i0.p1  ORF type:complete len:414 (-),score=106.99 NODE_1285_length_1566_cov_64.582349_g1214_i0:17-1258(-)
MRQRSFFRNMTGICVFAFLGTFISAFVTGLLVFLVGLFGWCHPMGALASFVFGGLISATDPVTVLAVFQATKVDMDLHSLVFGEAVLNDAVAIVFCQTLLKFVKKTAGLDTVLLAILTFFAAFLGSFLIGGLVAVLSSLLFKWGRMYDNERYLNLEIILLCLFPFVAFCVAEGLGLSGIVSILACGMTVRQYTYWNLSDEAQLVSKRFFKVTASLTETFVFVYLGLSLFTFPTDFNAPQITLLFLALLILLFSRACNIIPGSLLVNRLTRKNVSPKFQLVLWCSGLRGAVAFALAVHQWEEKAFPDNNDSTVILTITLMLSVITVVVFGGGVTCLLGILKLESSATEDQSDLSMESKIARFDRNHIKPLLSRRTHHTYEQSTRGSELETALMGDYALPPHTHDTPLTSPPAEE